MTEQKGVVYNLGIEYTSDCFFVGNILYIHRLDYISEEVTNKKRFPPVSIEHRITNSYFAADMAKKTLAVRISSGEFHERRGYFLMNREDEDFMTAIYDTIIQSETALTFLLLSDLM